MIQELLNTVLTFLETPEGQALGVAIAGAISAYVGKSERFGGESWKTLNRVKRVATKMKPVAVVGLGLGLAVLGSPLTVQAGESVPTVGCGTVSGGAGCSLYLFEIGWPKVVGVNAVEFVHFGVDVNIDSVDATATAEPLGFLCMAPYLDKLPLCGASWGIF
jgi:hypothetical protein